MLSRGVVKLLELNFNIYCIVNGVPSLSFIDVCYLQLKISNDFDPVHSPESSMFVLKSSKQVLLLTFTPTLLFLTPFFYGL